MRRNLTRTEVDLIFTKAKPKFERRLDFEHFLDALSAIAEKKYPDYEPADALRLLLHNHLAPHYDFVQEEMSKTGETEQPLTGIFKRLYDPRSYTGVYAERFRSGDGRINGETDNRPGRSFRGNTNTRTNETIHDMSVLMRPNLKSGSMMADSARRRQGSPRGRTPRGGASGTGFSPSGLSRSGRSARSMTRGSPAAHGRAPEAADPRQDSEALLAALKAAREGHPEDLMGLAQRLQQQVERGETGPARTGIQPSPLRRAGGGGGGGRGGTGPSPRGGGRGPSPHAPRAGARAAAEAEIELEAELEELEGDIAELENRVNEANDRVQALTDAGASRAEVDEALAEADEVEAELVKRRRRLRRLRAGQATPTGAGRRTAAPPPPAPDAEAALLERPPLTQEQLEEIFLFYANFGRSSAQSQMDTMDSFMFMKFARECPGLLDDVSLNRTEVDLIFTKAKPKGERRISFTHFLDALSAIAEKKYPDYEPADGLRLLLHNHLGPHYDVVVEEMSKTGETEIPLTGIFKRLYDPRSYTGVYAERFRSGDGRINGEADNRPGRSFRGNTNTRTNETIHDMSVLMRPNLRGGTMMRDRPRTSGGASPRRPGARGASPSRSMRMTASVRTPR